MGLEPTIPAVRLSELVTAIGQTLQNAFAGRSWWVVADVTSHTHKTDKNYHHFDLVENHPTSQEIVTKIHATAWGSGSKSIELFQRLTGQRFTNNIRVLVNVTVQFHPVYGLSLQLNQIDPGFTLGALEQQRRATLDRLVTENQGFIARDGERFRTYNQSLSLPAVIQRIAVISSDSSAGYQDFCHTLQHNPHGYQFRCDDYFTLVQGEANAEQVVDRLVDVFESAIPYDAVVIIRGGGAQTDFLIFDHYAIGKAIAKFPIPIITGIGHQKNETIADLMAYTVSKTPAQAAERIIAHNRGFEERLTDFQNTIIIRSQQLLSDKLQKMIRLQNTVTQQTQAMLNERHRQLLMVGSTLTSKPAILVANKKKDIQQSVQHLQSFTALYLKNKKGYLGHYVTLIKALSPERTLQRGFAIVKTGGRITSNPEDLKPGKDAEIILKDQSITTTVKSKTPYHGRDFNL